MLVYTVMRSLGITMLKRKSAARSKPTLSARKRHAITDRKLAEGKWARKGKTSRGDHQSDEDLQSVGTMITGVTPRLPSMRHCVIIARMGKCFWLRTPAKRAGGQSDFLSVIAIKSALDSDTCPANADWYTMGELE